MVIDFNSTERVTVEYVPADRVEKWLAANGWTSQGCAEGDYWTMWYYGIEPMYWVMVEASPELSDGVLARNQRDTFERLQRFMDKPARKIWEEMHGARN